MEAKAIVRQLYKLGVADDVFDGLGVAPRIGILGRGLAMVGVLGAGALIGAAIGLLVAPVPGSELRERARIRAGELRERAIERRKSIMDQVEGMRRGRAEPRI